MQATDDGRTLIVVNSQEGVLYNVDPETGMSTPIDLGGEVVNGDGLVRVRWQMLPMVQGRQIREELCRTIL